MAAPRPGKTAGEGRKVEGEEAFTAFIYFLHKLIFLTEYYSF